jgi:hypothetical protein
MSGMELLAELKEVSLETIRFLIISESEEGAMRGLVDVPQQVLTRPLDLKYFFHQVEGLFPGADAAGGLNAHGADDGFDHDFDNF